ncbi:MAG: hypothetical protein DI555_06940 [Novosphingobium pentaromativorans]|uniref:Uncharacterized protein n=1 Tax=Novosphingobium pentaromativorans TaxID=205844 RepID=A0A2W5NQS0_9SPHN|nr:MAG: hypothetical protein DI555_06940 [Novosphingobium pentaromativorans]
MKYRVYMKIVATGIVEVDADSQAEAIELANEEYADGHVSICHQCSDEIDDPTYIHAVEAVEVKP